MQGLVASGLCKLFHSVFYPNGTSNSVRLRRPRPQGPASHRKSPFSPVLLQLKESGQQQAR